MTKAVTVVLSVSCALTCAVALYFDYLAHFTPTVDGSKFFTKDMVLYTLFKSLAAFSFLSLCLYNYWNSGAPPLGLHQHRKTVAKWILSGQFLSVIGDITLALSSYDEVYFMVGGTSFLLAHVAYIGSFLSSISSVIRQGGNMSDVVVMSDAQRKKNDDADDDSQGVVKAVVSDGETLTQKMKWILFSFTFISIASYFIGFRYILPLIKPELTGLRTLATSYTVMITIMVGLSPAGESLRSNKLTTRGVETVYNTRFLCRVIGSFLFYLSDICVARNKFIGNDFVINKAIGLPLYFVAQLIIASSL